MGIEDVGMGASMDKKVTLAGQAGYQGAWDAQPAESHASPELVRDAAINSADIKELEEAVERLVGKQNPDTTTLEALARVRARIDELIRKGQN